MTVTLDDLPQEIKDLIDCGVYEEEEALARCSSNGSREQRMVLKKPMVRLVGENKTPVVQKFEERYKDDDLVLDYIYENSDTSVNEDEIDDSNTESADAGDMDWLKNL